MGSHTLFPSVWRDSGCESHFIIWRDRIYLFGAGLEGEDDERFELVSGDLAVGREVVLQALSPTEFEDAGTIADRLEALPWEVLAVCRKLVAEKSAVEGKGRNRAHFRRT